MVHEVFESGGYLRVTGSNYSRRATSGQVHRPLGRSMLLPALAPLSFRRKLNLANV